MLGAIARAGRTQPPLVVDLFTDSAIAVDEAFWGASVVLIGLAFVLFPSRVPSVGRVWSVVGGLVVVSGVVVAIRAAFPPHVKLTVTERSTAYADGGSGSGRGYVTDERGRVWEMSTESYARLADGDRVVCATRPWTWARGEYSGTLTGCKSVQAPE